VTDEYLVERGYKEYAPGPWDHDGVEKRFQKRFDDEVGKRYFIDVVKWKPFKHPHTGETFGPDYTYETQMYKKKTHDAVNFEFHSSWKLEDVEDFMRKQFSTWLYDYYELW